jgi:hydrogenase maturation protein HypF
MHPDYLSTRYAKEQTKIPVIEVQHHHAHIVSCMAEHKLEGAVIGLAFDGTGYGTNGTIWGGEVLVAEAKQFKRVAHLAEVPMPGSTAAIKEPWRMALSYLRATYGDNLRNLDLPLLKQIGAQKVNIIVAMMEKAVNCPQTSSLGRLFDAVAAIAGIRERVNFEGQAAMELEMLADGHSESIYDIQWTSQAPIKILPQTIIRGVVQDIQNGMSPADISIRFHRTLIVLFGEICATIRRDYDLNRVVLSGGCFQNSLLLKGLIGQLEAQHFEVFAHRQVPANDGGIALGQAIVAASITDTS